MRGVPSHEPPVPTEPPEECEQPTTTTTECPVCEEEFERCVTSPPTCSHQCWLAYTDHGTTL